MHRIGHQPLTVERIESAMELVAHHMARVIGGAILGHSSGDIVLSRAA